MVKIRAGGSEKELKGAGSISVSFIPVGFSISFSFEVPKSFFSFNFLALGAFCFVFCPAFGLNTFIGV